VPITYYDLSVLQINELINPRINNPLYMLCEKKNQRNSIAQGGVNFYINTLTPPVVNRIICTVKEEL